MWGLVVSALTIGASFLGKSTINESSSRSSESTQLIAAGGDQTFLSGVGTLHLLMLVFRSLIAVTFVSTQTTHHESTFLSSEP
jgi:hypothetical protein